MLPSNEDSCEAGPAFASSQYERGPTDKNSAMFPFEKKICDEIESRCGKATSPNSGMEMSTENGIPGQNR